MTIKQDSILIIVPTLDSYDLLSLLVKSLENQSWPFWKLLFIDGNSGDIHRQCLDDFCEKDSRCNWVKQKDLTKGPLKA